MKTTIIAFLALTAAIVGYQQVRGMDEKMEHDMDKKMVDTHVRLPLPL